MPPGGRPVRHPHAHIAAGVEAAEHLTAYNRDIGRIESGRVGSAPGTPWNELRAVGSRIRHPKTWKGR